MTLPTDFIDLAVQVLVSIAMVFGWLILLGIIIFAAIDTSRWFLVLLLPTFGFGLLMCVLLAALWQPGLVP